MSLLKFIFRDPEYTWFARIAIPSIIIQFCVFKFCYPYAGFINGDSYVYIETAYHNLPLNTYPIGYSKFLRLFSVFTRSDTAVVAFQYFFLQASSLSLVFTLFHFYKPARLTRILLFFCMLFNPAFLYLANYISSDAIFLAVSLTWFTLLIWIMNKPTGLLVVVNALVLFAAFTVRYNALFYPVISIVALFLTRKRVWMNIGGFAISILLIVAFVQATSLKYKEISGYRQFSPFTGWQMANNALYAYRYVDSARRTEVPNRFKVIDNLVRNYFDSTRDLNKHPEEGVLAGTAYMWEANSPLSIYMESKFKKDSTASALKKWAVAAPMMQDYGSFLVRTYPVEFAKYYLIPNAMKYYVPPVEFLDHYSTGIDSVAQIAQVWFDYKSKKIRTNLKDFKVNVLNFYPVFTGTMHVVLILSMLSFFLLNGYRHYPQLKRGILLVITLWAVNFGFSVFASPIALRFQLFPILVSFSFTFLLVEFLIHATQGVSKEDDAAKFNGLVADQSETAI